MTTQPPAEPPAASSAEPESTALAWLVRQRGGGFGAADEAALQAWLAADEAHGKAFARWQRDWDALDALPAEGVRSLRKKLTGDKAAAQARSHRRAWWHQLTALVPQGAVAAAALVVCCGGYLAWNHWQQPVFAQSFATARGQQLALTLPDATHLRLDTASRAEVIFHRRRRELRLPEGQTELQVKSDPSRPFDVWAGPLRITVVGTRFSVRHTPGIAGNQNVRVAVEEGRVRVAGDGAAVELRGGQQIVSDAAGRLGAVTAVPAAGIAPWRDSRVSFDNASVAQALAEFERYGPAKLIVRDPAVAALRVTGTFDPRRLDNFSRALPQVLPVRLREHDGMTEIVSAK
ncbi:FecR domain-containing protein [Variovorax sp. LjRoot84]|uniref:FecR family protein n=1 Tax=Variovorax sp. LjRoot84 TaxID=3342340 RepID=UPI003ECD1246